MKKSLIILIGLLFAGCGGEGGSVTEVLPAVVSQVDVPANATTLPLLVVQVEFNDQAFSSSTLTWYQKIFGAANGQLNHYFKEISQNSFVFIQAQEDHYSINDGFIKVHLNTNHPDTGFYFFENIAIPALTLADEFVDFGAYDTNTNGKIDIDELQIMFLVAGGEESTGIHPSIWAHKFCINGVSLDSVSVMQCSNGSYTAFGEQHFNIRADASIGIIAHELGHGAFYLPDLYDTTPSPSSDSEGIGAFGLMGAGSWGYLPGQTPGVTPVHMSAWSKIQTNFVTPTVVSIDTTNFSLDASELASYKPLRINTQDPNEYFLVENRSNLGYDAGLYMLDNTTFEGGLAIWHIDETQIGNTNVNQKLVDLEEADAKVLDIAGNRGGQSNLFKTNNNVFTKDSTVSNSDLYSGVDTNVSVTNVSAPGSSMFIDLAF
ncbi:MAG: hypothetical protein COA44_13740 [Arcobacter sp.]|nr:MAG: hypothetical protein COA44_13740 [Arcobacter sp.]